MKRATAWGGLILSGLALTGAVVLLVMGTPVPNELWLVVAGGGGMAVPSGY